MARGKDTMKPAEATYWQHYRDTLMIAAREWGHLALLAIGDGASIATTRMRAASAAHYAIKALAIRL